MIEWIFILVVIYLLYKLIFDFILPVSKASSQLRSKMNQMHQQSSNQTNEPAQKSRPPAEDYIDFEEIKTPDSRGK